ncbi:hypothetical protein [Acaryochloris marina]|uniref:DUF4367 domain-containing protein n=1 Tax=Acaryochloris marina (strain MBIC 11017) TaxID=329726 RepID=B0C953_ACAM1|nr:hypothetical protein [Acaryochloris marina]ABW26588.1 hypothetical protein AM1_1564 [Acaryochloris marina MBIC11017]
MKLSLQTLLISSLSMVGIEAFECIRTATAAPAPVFQPVISEIRKQLPPGGMLRLPAYLPDSDVTLYPYLKTDAQSFGVYLAFKPSCQVPSCTIGGAGILTQEQAWPPNGKNRLQVELAQGIQGYHIALGQGRGGKANYVYWQQDGQTYSIGALELGASKEEVIEMAKSMAIEPPISGDK